MIQYSTKKRARLAAIAAALAALTGCGSEKHRHPTLAASQLTSFCGDIAAELQAWAKQYETVNGMKDAERTAYESHLVLNPSVYARGAAVHQLQGELHLCVAVRKLGGSELGAYQDEAYHAALKLLDGDDDATIQKSLEGLWPVAKKINELPMDDDGL